MQAIPSDAVAIIGMAGRFPGARNITEFWRNICNGVESIRDFSNEELEDSSSSLDRSNPNFVRARAILDDVELFDEAFFGMHGREAALTDPQHRLFLETCWQAFEDAGVDPESDSQVIGVFAGASMNTYLLQHVLSDRSAVERFTSAYQIGEYATLMGALQDNLATRVAYKLNLRGPAVTIQSACSTSLLATAQAMQSLLTYQCDMALAGGVSITFPQRRGYIYQEGGIGSRTGKCRPFDANADGTVFGSGVGAILLKRLEDALADGDHIHAVIRGAGVNNDGSSKVGFTAPSANGQADAISAALAAADVDPQTIGYVECHGTATPLGDPIEFSGLVKAFRAEDGDAPLCALGSVKANVGHLDAAAGVAGLIKTALTLKYGLIPPLANFESPNPNLDVGQHRFYFPTILTPWSSQNTAHNAATRRAGVSAFGVGGTNVHLVLEAPPSETSEGIADTPCILPLSARSDEALAQYGASLADALSSNPDIDIGDVAGTLQTGRRRFSNRRVIVCTDRNDAIVKLQQPIRPTTIDAKSNKPIIFMFPGQGAQYPGMAKRIYETEQGFRADIDRGAQVLTKILGADIREAMFANREKSDLQSTLYAQSSIYLVEYALARLWMRWGVKPDAMIGHSVGEFSAAALSGVFSFEDGLRFVAERGRLMQQLPAGAMLALRVSEDDARELIGEELDIAAINGPSLCVASGPTAAIAALEALLIARNIGSRRLHTSHAFHSRAMDPVVAQIAKLAARISLSPARIPFVSSVHGDWTTARDQTSSAYWASHCRAPVQFARALATAIEGKAPLLLEVGPGRTLSMLANQCIDKGAASIVASLPSADEDADARTVLAQAVGDLWTHGANLNWKAITPSARRISLPTTPFERRRHWIEAPIKQEQVVPASDFTTIHSMSSEAPPTVSTHFESDAPGGDKDSRAQAAIIDLLQSLSGDALDNVDLNASFLELGFDSLFLGQVAAALDARFKLKITFRQLLNDVPSIAALALHLEPLLSDAPTVVMPERQPPSPITAPHTAPNAPPAGSSDIHALFAAQTQAMQTLFSEQLRVLQNAASGPIRALTQTSSPAPVAAPRTTQKDAAHESVATETPSRLSVYRPTATSGQTLSEDQQSLIDSLVARFNARAPKSKQITQDNRAILADPRSVAGFRAQWKDLVYPIVAARSKGSCIWDIDGNEYIDLVNGYGQTAFGHAPPFVAEALSAQLADGFAIGPQSPLAGEVAALIAEFTGAERVTFCNTGSEAVMAAMRVARTVTGRTKIVTFTNDYHGQFDEVLVKAGRAGVAPHALPAAPGVPRESIAHMIVLPYGEASSLDWIRDNAADLAAVIVEPVQSRHPELQPVEFVRALRKITNASATALVFDEVVTGFRVHAGGMQALWNVRADLTTYGKVLGGGMPIGVLAGCKRFMDALDGGFWRYGDASVPEIAPTFFAGTFVRHPLTLAAAKAVLLHLKQEGPSLQEKLNARTATLAAQINTELARRGIESRAECFSSWFYLAMGAPNWLGALFYPLMRCYGVNIQEGFPCFLTTAHSQADCDAIVSAISNALDELQAAGILSGPRAATKISSSVPATRPAPREAPLTEPQLEIWLTAQLGEQASCAFNESLTLRLSGKVNTDHLVGALNDVIARRDALRAHFSSDGGTMRIADTLVLSPAILQPSAEQNGEDLLRGVIAREARLAFNLTEGPLIRAEIVRLAPDQHALVLTAHHIICDGWSFNIVLEELVACCKARDLGMAPALPIPGSYGQYAIDQSARRIEASVTERFWLDLYADNPSPPDLPADRTRPAQRSFSGATFTAQFEAPFANALKKAGARQGATLFSTLLSGLHVLIGRLANHNDIVIAAPTAGQGLLSEQDLVGHCVNFLPLRAPFDWTTRFSDHLKAVKTHVLDAYEHQDYTFGTLIQKLAIPRALNRLPLTEIQFNLERVQDGLDFGAATARIEPNPKAFVNFDLFFNCIESESGIRIDCDYNADIFDRETIARWINHWRVLLQCTIDNPDLTIAELPLLSAEEQAWMLDALNATGAPRIQGERAWELKSQQTLRTPDAIACEDNAGALTYAQVEARSNQLAHAIQAAAPQPGGRIAIALPRCTNLIVAFLAVMKAGHAYVPLDPHLPEVRLRQIIEDADVAGFIAEDERLHFIFPASARRILLPQTPHSSEAKAPPKIAPRGDNEPAYVIFTSGTTGRPKGVEVSHSALVNFLRAMSRRPGFSQTDVIVAVTTVSFDIAALELFLPLVRGGRVVIATREEMQDGFALVQKLKTSRASVLQGTPALWRLLLEAGFKPNAGLRMLCGGEALPNDLAQRLLIANGELWNLYGPTETTIWSSVCRVERGAGAIVIGQPIDNTEIHILDARGQLCPVGAIGDLYIGGRGLANGYFGRPDLTQASFIMRVLPGRAPERLYRTGDLARRLPTGDIQVLGRSDQQVKLRGFRIELEDIETTLRTMPEIHDCAVTLCDEAGEARLVGYFVSDRDVAAARLVAYLATRLPAYMVPTRWVALPALPRTANGKLDRKALPAPINIGESASDLPAATPRSPLEEQLTDIWKTILRVQSISIHDNIFALGADSLQIFRIAAQLIERNLPVAAKDILAHPTIALLSETITQRGETPARTQTLPSLSAYRGGARRRAPP